MTQKRPPPVSLSEWMQQVEDDPSIPSDFKNGSEGRLKVSSTTFKSGSEISSTEYLHLNIIWHKYLRIESLGHLMKDDPDIPYAGYVSAENMRKADLIFDAKRHLWQAYFNELKGRAAEEKDLVGALVSRPLEQPKTARKYQQVRPSMEGLNLFWVALHFQLLAITTTEREKPSAEEIERTSAITKPGPGYSAASAPLSVNEPVSPSPRKLPHRLAQHREVHPNKGTPQTRSFLPGKGGQQNKPAADECYANNALVVFLQSITAAAGSEFSSLDWLGGRVGFKLVDCTDSTDTPETGYVQENLKMKKLIEARVDGYLCQRSSPFERSLNTNALAILEVKPFTLKAALSSIRRQEGTEMACWISEDDSKTALLQSSTEGLKRRWMISQHRHEIYIIVAEYGVGYEEHIRPSVTIAKDSTRKPATKAGTSSASSSTSRTSPQQDLSAVEAPATPKRRNPKLLAGYPSYLERVEKMSIQVSADSGLQKRNGQPTRPAAGMSEWAGEEQKWVPDAADFLIMHEFGPFLTTEDSHMEVFSKRVIAFMLQLSGSQDSFVHGPTDLSSSFPSEP